MIDKIIALVENIEEFVKENGITLEELNNIETQLNENQGNYSLIEYSKGLNNINLIRAFISKKDNKKTKSEDFNPVEVSTLRDGSGKIEYYVYKIYKRDKEPLMGRFDRREMEYILNSYSNYGAKLTQRQVSRYFVNIPFEDFKQILRAFNITKSSSPFAQHQLEEMSDEDLSDLQLRRKENNLMNKLDKDVEKDLSKTVESLGKELLNYKNKFKAIESLFENIDLKMFDLRIPYNQNETTKKVLIIALSDIHTGAYVPERSIYTNKYDGDEMTRRLNIVFKNISTDLYDDIYVTNNGDSLDGMYGQTCRGGHELPQNMDNKTQLHTFINVVFEFMLKLKSLTYNLHYYCVGESNHDGDFGYAANVALCALLRNNDIDAIVFDRFIDHFKINNRTYVLTHGKDDIDMGKGYPLNLNDKVENQINEYLDSNDITGQVTFMKGDLHQYSINMGRRFTYLNVPSLFGSSKWIHKNFGNTPWGVLCIDLLDSGSEKHFIINENNK